MADKVKVGELPPEAGAKGTLNESTPAEQRVPTKAGSLTSGPQVGEKGEYLPGSYKLRSGSIRTDR